MVRPRILIEWKDKIYELEQNDQGCSACGLRGETTCVRSRGGFCPGSTDIADLIGGGMACWRILHE